MRDETGSADRTEAAAGVRTPGGEGGQMLVPGVAPVTLRQRLEARAALPMLPTKAQRAPDFGLFDLNARNQLELFG